VGIATVMEFEVTTRTYSDDPSDFLSDEHMDLRQPSFVNDHFGLTNELFFGMSDTQMIILKTEEEENKLVDLTRKLKKKVPEEVLVDIINNTMICCQPTNFKDRIGYFTDNPNKKVHLLFNMLRVQQTCQRHGMLLFNTRFRTFPKKEVRCGKLTLYLNCLCVQTKQKIPEDTIVTCDTLEYRGVWISKKTLSQRLTLPYQSYKPFYPSPLFYHPFPSPFQESNLLIFTGVKNYISVKKKLVCTILTSEPCPSDFKNIDLSNVKCLCLEHNGTKSFMIDRSQIPNICYEKLSCLRLSSVEFDKKLVIPTLKEFSFERRPFVPSKYEFVGLQKLDIKLNIDVQSDSEVLLWLPHMKSLYSIKIVMHGSIQKVFEYDFFPNETLVHPKLMFFEFTCYDTIKLNGLVKQKELEFVKVSQYSKTSVFQEEEEIKEFKRNHFIHVFEYKNKYTKWYKTVMYKKNMCSIYDNCIPHYGEKIAMFKQKEEPTKKNNQINQRFKKNRKEVIQKKTKIPKKNNPRLIHRH